MASKYGKKAGEKVEKAMHERKHGTLKSGSSGKKVKSRKQAIAIGLSEARRAGRCRRRRRRRRSPRPRASAEPEKKPAVADGFTGERCSREDAKPRRRRVRM